MKNTKIKKSKPSHCKNNSNNYKNSEHTNGSKNSNDNKIEFFDSNINYNSNNEILINNDDSSSNTEDNFLTIEKAHNDNYNINMEKIRALSNNLNNSNRVSKNKKEYIFIKKDKKVFEKIISPKKKNKKEILININDANNEINSINKKILQKEINENYINIKKNKNENEKEYNEKIISRIKAQNNIKKDVNDSKRLNTSELANEINITKYNKNNDENSSSLNEVNTIKDDESIDLEPVFSDKKINNEKIKKIDNIEIKSELILKHSYNMDDNIIKKFKHKNNLKKNKKKITFINNKNRNGRNDSNLKGMEEEEKTIIYRKEKSDIRDIKIMSYFQKLVNKNSENNEYNFEEFKFMNKNYNHLSNNIMNSEKRIISPQIEILHSNSNDYPKKDESKLKNEIKKIKRNTKKKILEKKDKIKNAKKQNNINKNISKDKLIKGNIISKKRLNEKGNNRYYKEEHNANFPLILDKTNINSSINNNLNKKYFNNFEDNSMNLMPNYKLKKKEAKNSLDFLGTKNEIRQMDSNNNISTNKKNNILFISEENNNISQEKLKVNTKINLINIQKLSRLKSSDRPNNNKLPKKENKLFISNKKNDNLTNYKYETKKNRTYFATKNKRKIFNNSSNNIYKLNKKNKNEIIKNIKENRAINKENTKKNNKVNKNNNIQIANYINVDYVPPSANNIYIDNNLFTNFKKNEKCFKRSISPNNLNNNSLYSKMQSNKLVLLNKNHKQNKDKKKEFKININNEVHKEFFKNEERKNLKVRYSHNINNTEAYFFLNNTIIDISKSTKNKSELLIINNNCSTYTKGKNHLSPINSFRAKRIFSSFCSKDSKILNNNFNSTYNVNKRPSIFIKNKNMFKKNKIKINVDNILNTGPSSKTNSIINKEKTDIEIQTLSNKKITSKNYKEKNIKNNSLIDIIPLVPEENTQVISLKTMKYNLCTNSNHIMFLKLRKIFRNVQIMNIIIFFLTNNDLFYLSLVNNMCFKITKKIILKKIMNKIIYNINSRKLINKIWNEELLKYSTFNKINNFENAYNNYLTISNKYDNEITKDLLRTFPHDNSFHKGSECYIKLFNILKAYSNYNNEIGYAQGMNFIVAKLIKFFKCEKKAFIYLDSLFNKLKMEKVIGIFNNLENKMKIVQFLMTKLCPDIIEFLEKKKINHEIFTASWFITLFSKGFKYDNILLIIWNFSIIFGWKFIFLYSIAIVIVFKDKYTSLDLYDFTQYMKNIFNFEHFKNKFNEIMKLTFYYMSQWKSLIKEIKIEYYYLEEQ